SSENLELRADHRGDGGSVDGTDQVAPRWGLRLLQSRAKERGLSVAAPEPDRRRAPAAREGRSARTWPPSSGPSARTLRIKANPSSPGIAMSLTSTSGRQRCKHSSASSAEATTVTSA